MFEGMHTDMRNRRCPDTVKERYRAAWWTTYMLDCHMSGILGVPQSLSAHDVSAELPQLAASAQEPRALSINVKLAKATSSILKSGQLLHPVRHLVLLADDQGKPFTAKMARLRSSSSIASKRPSEASRSSTTCELQSFQSIWAPLKVLYRETRHICCSSNTKWVQVVVS